MLYFLLFVRVFRFRVLKFNPRIATTLRPHGKWGDLIVCLLPVSWCVNIITNSNFILRMIEWQAESSLFTIRIRGKQWYWIYKFELKAVTDILTTPKNIGSNKWVVSNPLDMQIADDYLHVLQLRTQSKWIKNYWEDSFLKETRPDKNRVSSGLHFSKLATNNGNTVVDFNFSENINIDNQPLENFNVLNETLEDITAKNNLSVNGYFFHFLKNKNSNWLELDAPSYKFSFSDLEVYGDDLDIFGGERRNFLKANFAVSDDVIYQPFKKNYAVLNTHNAEVNESFRWVKKTQGAKMPMRVIKNPLNVTLNMNNENIDLFRVRWNVEESTITHKVVPHSYFWTFKQKKYKRRKSILIRYRYYRDENGKLTKRVKHAHKPIVNQDNMLIDTVDFDRMVFYRLYKKMKRKTETVALPHSKRMLRTRKILVLPAHVNLAVITNSYDVVHSWFIPGLGLKMDCIPGRATHHVLHIDNVGFYYGQCAEICGRYHHHMPIRLCALPFEHFLVWWHSFGLPKIINTTDQKRLANYYTFRKYVW